MRTTAQPAPGAEGDVLGDGRQVGPAVADPVDEVGEVRVPVPRGEDDPVDTDGGEGSDLVLDERPRPDGEQGLRAVGGQGGHAASAAPGEDDGVDAAQEGSTPRETCWMRGASQRQKTGADRLVKWIESS